jgi:hypothetical protein
VRLQASAARMCKTGTFSSSVLCFLCAHLRAACNGILSFRLDHKAGRHCPMRLGEMGVACLMASDVPGALQAGLSPGLQVRKALTRHSKGW